MTCNIGHQRRYLPWACAQQLACGESEAGLREVDTTHGFMAGVAADLHSGSTEWEGQQHMDNGLSLLPVTSPRAAHSLRPAPLHPGT